MIYKVPIPRVNTATSQTDAKTWDAESKMLTSQIPFEGVLVIREDC